MVEEVALIIQVGCWAACLFILLKVLLSRDNTDPVITRNFEENDHE